MIIYLGRQLPARLGLALWERTQCGGVTGATEPSPIPDTQTLLAPP